MQNLEENKSNAIAFYQMAYDGNPRKGVQLYVGAEYIQHNPNGRVSLVLGAGNVSSIVPLDIFYKLYAEGEVVMIK